MARAPQCVLTNLALLFVLGIATWTIGLQTYLLIQTPIILIAGSLGLWLFYIQHQFEDVYWIRHESWDPLRVALEGSSYFKLPRILQWLTGNIGFHHPPCSAEYSELQFAAMP